MVDRSQGEEPEKKDARAQLAERAKEAYIRLESQRYSADHMDGSDRAVPEHRFRAMEDEVGDLRYLVGHLVMVLKRNGINPFSKK